MHKVVAFGEVMLRLKPPGAERILQSPCFEATFGGGEANAAAALAGFGLRSFYVSSVPDNPLGEACISELRKHGIITDYVLKTGKRLGIYFLEQGANQRPSAVYYDRENSSVSLTPFEQYSWDTIFENASWFHITGITPAISLNAADAALKAVKTAAEKKITVSCDLNYRGKLWKYGKSAPEVMNEIIKYTDIAIGNEEDCQKSLGIDTAVSADSGELDEDKYRNITDKVLEKYSNLKKIALTLRQSRSADINGWSALLNNRSELIHSRRYEIADIVDRVGSGDAFAGGLIYGLLVMGSDAQALEFAAAASCLKHSIPGDFPKLNVNEVMNLLEKGGSGRVVR